MLKVPGEIVAAKKVTEGKMWQNILFSNVSWSVEES